MEFRDEKELIVKIRQNDTIAENYFHSVYCPKIRLIVSYRVNQLEDRQEIVNDILLAAITNIKEGRYDSNRDSNISKYIYGITKNKITQYYRDFYREREKGQVLSDELKESPGEYMNQNELEENEEIENQQKTLRNSINKLKPKYRKVVYLRYYKNLSVTEISEEINISAQKVSDYLKYSKQLLMQITKKIKE